MPLTPDQITAMQTRLTEAITNAAADYVHSVEPRPLLKPIADALCAAYIEGLRRGGLLVIEELQREETTNE